VGCKHAKHGKNERGVEHARAQEQQDGRGWRTSLVTGRKETRLALAELRLGASGQHGSIQSTEKGMESGGGVEGVG
jgi:hypothetical protein